MWADSVEGDGHLSASEAAVAADADQRHQKQLGCLSAVCLHVVHAALRAYISKAISTGHRPSMNTCLGDVFCQECCLTHARIPLQFGNQHDGCSVLLHDGLVLA